MGTSNTMKRGTWSKILPFSIFRNSFYKEAYVWGKGKPTEDPFKTRPTQTNLGEDSYFLVETDRHLTFGVSDGVGGWTLEKDGRPDLISRGFMKHCEQVTREYDSLSLSAGIASQIIFAQAYERLQQNPPGLGSATALVFNISPYQEQ